MSKRAKKIVGISIHRLKNVLLNVKPQVWRRIEVESNTKLSRLSPILLKGMGWSDLHLHQISVGGKNYSTPNPDFPRDSLDEGKHTLDEIAKRARDSFYLHYDFGDGWEHRIAVETIKEAAPGVKYPR